MDLSSLERVDSVVTGWAFNVMKAPVQQDYAPTKADTQWTQFTIDCSRQVARFTWAIGHLSGDQVYATAVPMPEVPVHQGWTLDAAYACENQSPERPVILSIDDALAQAREVMASDAWSVSQ